MSYGIFCVLKCWGGGAKHVPDTPRKKCNIQTRVRAQVVGTSAHKSTNQTLSYFIIVVLKFWGECAGTWSSLYRAIKILGHSFYSVGTPRVSNRANVCRCFNLFLFLDSHDVLSHHHWVHLFLSLFRLKPNVDPHNCNRVRFGHVFVRIKFVL